MYALIFAEGIRGTLTNEPYLLSVQLGIVDLLVIYDLLVNRYARIANAGHKTIL